MTAGQQEFPRPLSTREAATLRFMLSADDPRLDPLREQAKLATVSGMCSCGCATIDLAIDRNSATAAHGLCSPVAETENHWQGDSKRFRELILFLDDGWLQSLEIVYHDGPAPTQFPPAEEFNPPRLRC